MDDPCCDRRSFWVGFGGAWTMKKTIATLRSVPTFGSFKGWMAKLPSELTAGSAHAAAVNALGESSAVVRWVADQFKGTTPPPPWPAPPGLVQARARVATMRDGLAVFARVPSARMLPKVRAALVREVEALYRQNGALLKRFHALPTLKNPLDLLWIFPWWVVPIAALYLLSNTQRHE